MTIEQQREILVKAIEAVEAEGGDARDLLIELDHLDTGYLPHWADLLDGDDLDSLADEYAKAAEKEQRLKDKAQRADDAVATLHYTKVIPLTCHVLFN